MTKAYLETGVEITELELKGDLIYYREVETNEPGVELIWNIIVESDD